MVIVTEQQLIDAGTDADTLESVVNGAATLNGTGTLTSRLGTSLTTLAKIIDNIVTTDIDGTAAALINIRLDDFGLRLLVQEMYEDLQRKRMPYGAAGIWFFKNFSDTHQFVPNSVSSNPALKLITRHPRGVFETGQAGGEGGSGGWIGDHLAAVTVTENYAAGRDGKVVASRFQNTGTGSLGYRKNFTLPAGTYTMAIDVKSNIGNTNFRMSHDGGSTYSTFTATSTLQQFKHEFTLGAPATFNGIFIDDDAAVAQDFTIDNAFLWDGVTGDVPALPAWQGDMYFGNTSEIAVADNTGYLDTTGGGIGSAVLADHIQTTSITMFACVRRNAAYTNNAGANRYPWITNPQQGPAKTNVTCLGEFEAEGGVTGTTGSRVLSVRTDLDLNLDDGNWHIISVTAEDNSQSLWLEDVQIAINNLPNIPNDLLAMQCGSSSASQGMVKFDVNALAVYPFKLTADERRQAINGLISNAADNGFIVSKPVNSVIACGDSITNLLNGYPSIYRGNAAYATVVTNESIAGSKITGNPAVNLNLDVRIANHIESIPPADQRIGRSFIVTIMIGTNDIRSYPTADWLANLWALTVKLKQKGAIVGVATVLPLGSIVSGYADHNSKRSTINTAILAAVGGNIDFAIDFAGISGFGADADANDTAKYPDGIHPIIGAHTTYLEPVYRAAVDAQLTVI